MITQNDILERVFEELAKSSALRAAIVADHGFDPTIALGWDVDTEAELRQTPAIVLSPWMESGDAEADQPKAIAIRAQLLISDPTIDATPVPGAVSPTVRRSWPSKLIRGAAAVRTAIVAALADTNAPVDQIQVTYELLDWPVVTALLTFTCAMSNFIGGEQFLNAPPAGS